MEPGYHTGQISVPHAVGSLILVNIDNITDVAGSYTPLSNRTIGEKQRHFCKSLTRIEILAYSLGYELVREDAFRDTRLHGGWGVKSGYSAAYSVHKIKLAQDYSVFLDGVYLTGHGADNAFNKMHDLGDKLGLAERIDGDLGHFSMEHQGYR